MLCTYAKSWERANDIHASQELIHDKLNVLKKTSHIFSGSTLPFSDFLTYYAAPDEPRSGVQALDSDGIELPALPSTSVAVSASNSNPVLPTLSSESHIPTSIPIIDLEYNVDQLSTTMHSHIENDIITPDTTSTVESESRRRDEEEGENEQVNGLVLLLLKLILIE